MIVYTTLAAIGMTAGFGVKGYMVYKKWEKRKQETKKNQILTDMLEQLEFEHAIQHDRNPEQTLDRTFTQTALKHPQLFEKEIQEIVQKTHSKAYAMHFKEEWGQSKERSKKKENQHQK